MEKHFLFFDSYMLLCLLAACSTEEYLAVDTPARHETGNLTGRYLLQLMNEQEDAYRRLQETAFGKTILYDYATTSFTTDYGTYYALPYCGENGTTVEGCILYPVDEDLPLPQRKFSGFLGNPIQMDAQVLNEEVPIERRFLYSTHFEQLERQGLSVEKELTEMAALLRKGPIEVEDGRIKETRKSTRVVDDIGLYGSIEFYYRADGQETSVTQLPDGSYIWEVTAYTDPYSIIEKSFKRVMEMHSPYLQIMSYQYSDDRRGTVSLDFGSLRPLLQEELVDMAYILIDFAEADLSAKNYQSYFSFRITRLEGLSSGSGSGGDSGASSGGGSGSGNGGTSGVVGGGGGDEDKPLTHEDSLKVVLMNVYFKDDVKNLIRSALGVEWNCVKLTVTDRPIDGWANASYNSQTDELIVHFDRIMMRMDSYGWTNDDVVSILFHEYVHVKQKFVDGLVLERDGLNIVKDKYKIYYGEADVQKALQLIDKDMEIVGGMTKEEREMYYNILYQKDVSPILEQIKRSEYYILKGNKDVIASEIEAYERQLELFGMKMSPHYRQNCEENLDIKREEYELIKNAEKL